MQAGRARTFETLAALLPCCVVLLASALAWRSSAAWFGVTEQAMVMIALLGTAAGVAAIARDDVRLRVLVSCGLLLGAPALRLGELLGHELPYITWDHGSVASIVSVVVLVVIVGLLRRQVWGRWIALAGSLAGLGGSLLNGLGSLADPGMSTWGHACAAAGTGTLVLLLAGPTMRDAFEGTTSNDGLWRSQAPVVRALRWALIATLVAAPMLLVYALTQPIVPGTVPFAWALVITQLVATVLCLRRKVIGALLLSLAGVALLSFTLVCVLAVARLGTAAATIMAYYAVFWTPAGLASMIASAVMLRPLRALLRRAP